MAFHYEDYEKYRDRRLNIEEQEQYDKAVEEQVKYDANTTLDKVEGGFMYEGRFAPDPMFGFQESMALDRAGAQMTKPPRRLGGLPVEVPYPDDRKCISKWPGVDPKGKYSDVDMAFAQREQSIRYKLALRPFETQEYVGGILDSLHDEKNFSPFTMTRLGMESASKEIRLRQRAAKLCLDEEVSYMMLDRAQAYTQSDEVKLYDDLLTSLEQLSGLKPGNPSLWIRKNLEKFWKRPIPEAVMEDRDMPDLTPIKASIHFPNLEHQLQQQYFASPNHWGEIPPEGKELDRTLNPNVSPAQKEKLQENMDKTMSRYATVCAGQALDTYFGPTERHFMDNSCKGINRGNLISINGETVQERMFREYMDTHKGGAAIERYQQWYKDNHVQRTNELVSAALMAGDHVEAYIPNEKGRLPKEPMTITKDGYEPKPLQKVVLNAWERHFAKHGFYKEKAAKAKLYEDVMECRKRTQMRAATIMADSSVYNPQSKLVKSLYFGNNLPTRKDLADRGLAEGRGPKEYYNAFDRAGAVTACMFGLAAEGHRIEDIMDPTKLQFEKRVMGQTYREHWEINDEKWIGETLCKGSVAMSKEIDRLAAARDLTDKSELQRNGGIYQGISMAMFDVTQNIKSCRAEFNKAADEFYPKLETAGNMVFDRLFASCGYLNGVMPGIMSEQEFGASTIDTPTSQLGRIMGTKALMDQYREDMKNDPKETMTNRYLDRGEKVGAAAGVALTDVDMYTMVDPALDNVEFQKNLGEMIQQGKLDQVMKYTGYDRNTLENGKVEIDREACKKLGGKVKTEKELAKEEAKAEKLQEQRRKQQQKQQAKQKNAGGRTR